MLLMRNFVYWLVLLLITPIIFVLLMVAMPLPRRWRHVLGVIWARVLVWALEYVIGLKYRVLGREHIPLTPSIICSKHQSGWETLAFQKIFPMHVYVAKRELVWIPIFGWGLLAMNSIIINRQNKMRANQQIMEQGKRRLQQGFWVTVFPEGTRIQPGQRGKYKLGAARLAQALNVPIVPVAHNAGEFWPRNSFFKYPGIVTVVVGPAIYPVPDRTAEELMAEAETWIEGRQREIGGIGPYADPDERQRAQGSGTASPI